MDETVDRQWVADLVRATIEEDLAGGVDVTTTATVDPSWSPGPTAWSPAWRSPNW